MRGFLGVAFAGSFVVSACSAARENPSVLTDTTGATFGWSCPASGCGLEVIASTPHLPVDCPAGSGWGWVAGTFFETCYFEPDGLGDGAAATFPASCRPVVCSSDQDCPYAAFGDNTAYACRNGLCESEEPLGADDVLALCLSSMPRPTTCDVAATSTSPAMEKWSADVGVSCPPSGPCTVPPDCRQP